MARSVGGMDKTTLRNARAVFAAWAVPLLKLAAVAAPGYLVSVWWGTVWESVRAAGHQPKDFDAMSGAVQWVLDTPWASATVSAVLLGLPSAFASWLWKERKDARSRLIAIEEAEDRASKLMVFYDQQLVRGIYTKHHENGGLEGGPHRPNVYWDLFIAFGPRLRNGIPRRIFISEFGKFLSLECRSFDTTDSKASAHLRDLFNGFVACMFRANLVEPVLLETHFETWHEGLNANNSYKLTTRGERLLDGLHGNVPLPPEQD
jgi:hypothetical protein